jgi:hypothetical protein
MSGRYALNRCRVCSSYTLPAISDYDGKSIPKIHNMVTCSNCGARYRLRKDVLALAQNRMSLTDWIAPNVAAIVLTLGLGLIVITLLFLISRVVGVTLLTPLYRKFLYKRIR